ncbi:MAG: putative beta-barrel porin 2 [Verrucomicrobiota bacterium]|jgi:hypothetical protein
MKKILASAGLVALGVSSVQSAPAVNSGTADKPWDVSLAVRGFYDDNNATASGGVGKKGSYGTEIRPSIGISKHGEQTMFGARYTYSMRYYEARKNNQIDHGHDFNAWLTHAFSERYSVDFADTFTISQEPTVTDPSLGTPIRANGNNIHNNANLNFHAQLTRSLELVLGYKNDFYDYEKTGGAISYYPFTTIPSSVASSYSGTLDRIEHTAIADLHWRFLPETVAVFGYQFGWNDYTGKEAIGLAGPVLSPLVIMSKDRNSTSHFVYGGVDHAFTRNLTSSVRVGAQFSDYYNAHQTGVSPWADASLRYTYRQNSYLELGVTHKRNATDAFSSSLSGTSTSITTDQETTSAFGTWQHAITQRLIARLTGQYSSAKYNGGSLGDSGTTDNIYLLGASAEYHFTRHLSAEAGYNYTKVDSNIGGRGYARNQVFLGMNLTY